MEADHVGAAENRRALIFAFRKPDANAQTNAMEHVARILSGSFFTPRSSISSPFLCICAQIYHAPFESVPLIIYIACGNGYTYMQKNSPHVHINTFLRICTAIVLDFLKYGKMIGLRACSIPARNEHSREPKRIAPESGMEFSSLEEAV